MTIIEEGTPVLLISYTDRKGDKTVIYHLGQDVFILVKGEVSIDSVKPMKGGDIWSLMRADTSNSQPGEIVVPLPDELEITDWQNLRYWKTPITIPAGERVVNVWAVTNGIGTGFITRPSSEVTLDNDLLEFLLTDKGQKVFK